MRNQKELLSKQDAVFLLELIHANLSCSDEEELRELIRKLKYIIPYEFALCGFGKTANGGLTDAYNILNINYPTEWLELYVLKDFVKIDPIVEENCANFRLQYWVDTYKKYGSPKVFILHAEDFGLRAGYTHGVRNFTGSKGSLFSFAGTSIEHHPRTELILEYIIPHLNQALTRIYGYSKKVQNIYLSQREKETLNWIKHGKSTWDISIILAVSENTVKFHVKNILLKLNSVSRAQAVAVAIEQGLIDIE